MHLNVKMDAIAFDCYGAPMTNRDTPPSAAAVAAWARLLRVSQGLLSAVEADLKAADLPPLVWYDVLLELHRAGRKGLRPYELQDVTVLTQYNLSRLAERLQKAGYVERLPWPEDRRGHILRITADGRRVRRKMWPVYRAAIAGHFAARLDPEDVRRLTAVLGKLV